MSQKLKMLTYCIGNWISAKSALSEFQNIFHANTTNIIHKILIYT